MLSIKDFMKSPTMTEEEKQRFVEDMKKDEEQRRRTFLDESNRMFRENQQRLDNQQRQYKEMLVDVQVEASVKAARIIEAEKQVKNKKVTPEDNTKTFDKRLAVLKQWLLSQGYSLEAGQVKHINFNHNQMHIELNKFSADKELFNIELESFKRHFWKVQKIAKLKGGRPS